MNRRQFLLSTAAATPALACLGRAPLFADKPMNPPSADIITGNTAFAFELYGHLRKKDGNLFCSPLSVSTALAMTSAGAQNATLAELTKTLHLPADQTAVHRGFATLTQHLTDAAKSGGYELRIANALWAQSGFSFREQFQSVLRQNYGAGFQTVDFANPEAARQTINRWVEEQTKDKIKNLFPSGVLDAATRLVLTNAIYFKGMWLKTFAKEFTNDEPFHSAGSSSKVPMMHQTTSMRYAEGEGWQAIELPYSAGSLALTVILPGNLDGLPQLEAGLDAARFQSIVGACATERVSLSLPRFKATAEFSLNQALQQLGLQKAFSKDADFGKMCDEPMALQAVVHKAYVDVNEEGSEAAAATGAAIRITSTARPSQPKIFKADHPFLFAIRDTSNGSVLFLGRLTKP